MNRDPADVVHGFVAAWNAADADALTACFTEDADFVNVVGFWWHGHRQIRHNHAIGFRDMFPDTEMTLERTRIRLLDHGHAVVQARWAMTGQRAPDGSRGGTRRGVFTFVCSRQPGGEWLAVTGHNTDVVPGAQTHLAGGEGFDAVRY